ncbi:MAG: hypothetical protein IJZ37_05255 [Clostridia bacterium]|nr:hypothetical protein [Clostridia bacterium]MBQ8400157.1 hypothetical protein [Clostridia bacterium]
MEKILKNRVVLSICRPGFIFRLGALVTVVLLTYTLLDLLGTGSIGNYALFEERIALLLEHAAAVGLITLGGGLVTDLMLKQGGASVGKN